MSRESHWRTAARVAIALALAEGRAEGLEGPALLARVDAAYPFGERSMHPYKVWLDQRRRQCGSLLPERFRQRKPSKDEEWLARLEADMRRVAGVEITLAELRERGELRIGERVFLEGGIKVMRWDGRSPPFAWSRGKYFADRGGLYLWPDLTWHIGIRRSPGLYEPENYPGYFDDLETLVDCLFVASLHKAEEEADDA